jgi:Cys-tRNA(Pro)/Cys-tRNA(Cys) deacylase
MAKKVQTGTPATTLLVARGIAHTLHAYDHDPTAHDRGLAYGIEAAVALGIDPERVFKTLIVQVDTTLVVAIVPVRRLVDLKAVAAAAGGKKATMADQAAVERSTGYVLGGTSPLGQRKHLVTVLDESALSFETILVSAGRRGLDVELAAADLIALTAGHTAAIAR